jgi:stage II sporulation protein D
MGLRSRSVVTGAVAFGVVLPLAAPAAADPSVEPRALAGGWVTTASTGVTLYGKGNGHGRGMSQYGARGAALKGLNATQILNFYYPGTASTKIGPRTMRVRLRAADGKPVIIRPTSGATVAGVTATSRTNGRRVPLPTLSQIRLIQRGNGFNIQKPVGRVWGTMTWLPSDVQITGPSVFTLRYPAPKWVCRRSSELTFRGILRAAVSEGAARFMAHVSMEEYVKGVIPSESPASWPAAALQAQAIAARSYGLTHMKSSNYYDVVDTTNDQCWDGKKVETSTTNAAAAATAGVIRSYQGRPINAQYSSDNGGWTAPGGAPYLVGKVDPYNAQISRSPHLVWSLKVSAAKLAALDGAGGITRVTAVRVYQRDGAGVWGGRAVTVQISGYTAAGRATHSTVSGTSVRSALGLKSTYFGLTKP